MNNPLVSVVLCTFNDGKYIRESIDAVLAQTFSDFEFIIWNDGSSDSTEEIAKSFRDDRIRYFYHENTGLGKALAFACNEAKGKYIARIDGDDICLPSRLEKEVEYLEQNKDCVLVSSAVNYINEQGYVIGRSFPYSKDWILKDALNIPSSFIVHPMAMIRSDAYKKAGGYLPIRKSQDVLFWSRLAKQGLFYNIPTPLGNYRILQSSLDHHYNPYKPVLMSLLKKMVGDDVVSEEDIDLYNDIFVYSKKCFERSNDVSAQAYKKEFDERLFDVLKLLMGREMAEKAVVNLKNVTYSVRHIL